MEETYFSEQCLQPRWRWGGGGGFEFRGGTEKVAEVFELSGGHEKMSSKCLLKCTWYGRSQLFVPHPFFRKIFVGKVFWQAI
mgnify:CR=1 FL=1